MASCATPTIWQSIDVCPPPQVSHAITVMDFRSDKPSIFLLKASTWDCCNLTNLQNPSGLGHYFSPRVPLVVIHGNILNQLLRYLCGLTAE